ncbi:restriction endonuclease subunit R [Candidatus Omnitrophus magneticus]|uniref:Type I restriction enzyme endonuclease subunit n=1 Tax=Candidatus Omnitrophus magneticus TaxID=1609969 RepID=A0A0F0CVQ3_9BACT|nr:restriction endonuclease subunit R [Candidatus Omnitrophus magneticus]
MSKSIIESEVEQVALDILAELKYKVVYGPDIAPDGPRPERQSYADVILIDRLREAIERLNPTIPAEAKEEALKQVMRTESPDPVVNNHRFHRMLVDGVEVEYRKDGRVVGDKVWLFDFKNTNNNEFLAVNQFTIVENNVNRRPDIVLFVNGLPLAVIELKNPADENATTLSAFKQFQTYKSQIPSLFKFNEVLVASDGFDAKAGTITSDWERFLPWKTIDGKTKASKIAPQIDVLLRGMFNRDVFIDLVRHFVVFEQERDSKENIIRLSKKIAAYHQYHAVNKAIDATLKASSAKGDKRCGVVWHTQGSGKSLIMAFYTGKLVLALDNPTVVVLTDRNDLDDQLFGTFSRCKELLRQSPVQADSRTKLQEYLKVSSGGVVFTTIQKFFPEEKGDQYPVLSDRRNIVVIADEAHRSQYDFIDGFAKHMRDALPKASFIGFTGTPIERQDRNTIAVFGDYIDIYDIEQAVNDGATVRIFYESRLAKLELKLDERPKIDPEFEEVTEGEELKKKEKLKTRWARLEAIVGSEKRIKQIAKDIVTHFEERSKSLEGKGMIVCMSRRIVMDLHNEIIKLKPEWYEKDDDKGFLKVIMTGAAADPVEWQEHIRNKQRRRDIGDRMKDPSDPLKLVIVRDMWLTGFDAPSLHTMYIDKPMRGHGLMQAIARVNRVFKDKPGGLVVDYLGIADDLKKALAEYTESGGKGKPAFDQEEAVALMLEKYEIVCGMFDKFDYKRFFAASVKDKMSIITLAQEHILTQKKGKDRFLAYVTQLSQAFALSVPHEEALKIRDDVGFFQAVRARIAKYETGTGKTEDEMDSAIKQIISRAIASDKVIDIFEAAGIKKPDISILSDEFLADVKGMPHKNLAFELLKKLLSDEIKSRSKKNLMQGRSFAEMLEKTIRKYQNKAIEAAKVIAELIELAKKIREADKRGEDLGLNQDEIAFYDALEVNDSAVNELGDDTLKTIARELVTAVRNSVTIDWTLKESIQAKLRVMVKRVLRKHGYPPDKEKKATETVLEQATLLCRDWAEKPEGEEKSDLFFSDVISDGEIKETDKYVDYLPVYSLQAVATNFGDEQHVQSLGWKKVASRKLNKDMFIAKVVGKSMEPTITDGSYCIFRYERGGSRNGLVVLVESRLVSDPETNQKFTVKRYHSEKEDLGHGEWRHKRIVLSPDNKDFKDIVIKDVEGESFRVIAEFVDVL